MGECRLDREGDGMETIEATMVFAELDDGGDDADIEIGLSDDFFDELGGIALSQDGRVEEGFEDCEFELRYDKGGLTYFDGLGKAREFFVEILSSKLIGLAADSLIEHNNFSSLFVCSNDEDFFGDIVVLHREFDGLESSDISVAIGDIVLGVLLERRPIEHIKERCVGIVGIGVFGVEEGFFERDEVVFVFEHMDNLIDLL